MKKIFLTFISLLFLFSCSSDNLKDGLVDYSGEGFTMRIPLKWEVLKDKTSILPKPKVGNIELATTSKIKKDGFANSMTIISEDLEKEYNSSDYSISNNLTQKGDFNFYNEISKKTISFTKKLSSIMYIFDAKYNLQTPKAKFLQTGIVCGKKGYVITISIPAETKDTLKYEYIFSTFRCK